MALGIVHPLPADGTDPHAVISFPPEADTLRASRPHSQRAEQALDPAGFVFEEEGFDCRVGDKRRHEAAVAAEKAAAEGRQDSARASAADGGRAGSAGKRGKPPTKGEKDKAAKPAGPLPKGWRCISKTHASGQREGQRYKVYISPGGKQYLSYVSAQADFAGKPPLPPKPALQPAPVQPQRQPHRAEYLPPDWAFVKGRNGGKTYVGPDGQRISSWHGLLEELAGPGIAGPNAAGQSVHAQQPQAQVQPQHPGSSVQQPPAASGGAAAHATSRKVADGVIRPLAAWLWRLAREVQHERNDLTAEEQRLAQRAARLRLARLRHD